MSLEYLQEAFANNDTEKLIRYVRLHFGDGNEKQGAAEINKSWIEALRLMLESPATDRQWILEALESQSAETLAHMYFHLHFYFIKQSGQWIHDGEL